MAEDPGTDPTTWSDSECSIGPETGGPVHQRPHLPVIRSDDGPGTSVDQQDRRPDSEAGGTLASWWRRAGATAADVAMVRFPVVILLQLAGGTTQITTDVITAMAYFVYLVVMIGTPRGQTIGNRWLHTRVVDARNPARSVTPGQAAIRAAVILVLQLTIIGWVLDVLWPLWDSERQTLHDKAARSAVVTAE